MIDTLTAYLSISYESLLVLIVTAVSCAILSPFLVLRKLSMVSDAISHSVLLGIVIAFFIVKDVGSPFLIIGAYGRSYYSSAKQNGNIGAEFSKGIGTDVSIIYSKFTIYNHIFQRT